MNPGMLIEEIKALPDYAQKCGMILAHNGTVRGWSRSGRQKVLWVETKIDQLAMAEICRAHETMPGVFAIRAQGFEGRLMPGDDMLFLVVGADLRENALSCMKSLLDDIKSKAVTKKEKLAEAECGEREPEDKML